MAHFANIDANNIVTNVIVVDNVHLIGETFQQKEASGVRYLQACNVHGDWVQTSYNGNMRRRYAGIGMTYSAEHDAFILPQPYPSWVFDLDDADDWVAPVPKPTEECENGLWQWNEEGQNWECVIPTIE